jgi:ribosomal protein S27E
MALSRKARKAAAVCLVLACIAIGVGAARYGPAIPFVWVALGGLIIEEIQRRRAWERAAFKRRDRLAHRADNTAQAAEKTDTTTTKMRCLRCQHVQTVPRSQPTFTCEQCKAHLVMPIIDGIDLRTLVQREGPLSPARAVHVSAQLASALGAAHADGVEIEESR